MFQTACDVVGVLPVIGGITEIGTVAKAANKASDVAKAVDKADDIVKHADEVIEGVIDSAIDSSDEFADVAKNIEIPKPKYKPDYDKHMVEVQRIERRGGQGVIGGHNYESFTKAFTDQGWDMDDCIISVKSHPDFDGIYEVKYQIPAMDKGKIVEGQYKKIKDPKTIYDPSKIPDWKMLEWGQQAMEEGLKTARIINDRIIDGYASKGLKFRGYINMATGEITNFFPTLN